MSSWKPSICEQDSYPQIFFHRTFFSRKMFSTARRLPKHSTYKSFKTFSMHSQLLECPLRFLKEDLRTFVDIGDRWRKTYIRSSINRLPLKAFFELKTSSRISIKKKLWKVLRTQKVLLWTEDLECVIYRKSRLCLKRKHWEDLL